MQFSSKGGSWVLSEIQTIGVKTKIVAQQHNQRLVCMYANNNPIASQVKGSASIRRKLYILLKMYVILSLVAMERIIYQDFVNTTVCSNIVNLSLRLSL